VLVSADEHTGEGTTKSGKGRTVPMVDGVARALATLGQRHRFAGPGDLVFPGTTGDHLDGSALRRRYKEAQTSAKLRPLRFHDLRHTFGSLAIRRASIVDVQHYLGHADSKTTTRYLHYAARTDEAKRLGEAFALSETTEATAVTPDRAEA